MKQPNSLVQISVNDVDLDRLSECAGQILAKEEAVLVIGGHLQHSSLLEKQKIYQALEPRLLLLLEGEADLCVNLQDSHFEKGSIALVASDTIFEMKHISDDARVAVVIFRKDNEEIEDTFLTASPEEFERVVHLIMLLRDFMRVSPYRRRTVRSLLQTLVADVQEIRDGQTPDGPEREARPRELFVELLLSAKLQNDTISLSATPINRRCGFFFRKVSPLSQRVKVRRVDYCGYPRPSTNLFRDARRNCSSQCST